MLPKHVKIRLSLGLVTVLLAAGSFYAQSVETDLTAVAGFFETAQVVDGPSVVDCTLSGRTKTSCFSI